MVAEPAVAPRRITSVEIGRRAGGLCWVFGLVLISAGGVATFVSDNQAGTTALILFGGLLLFIAITRRVPLLIEVGNAKLDTSYEAADEAFEIGRESAEEEPEPRHSPEKSRRPIDYDAVLGASYRGAVAARAAGISYRQLDYWARTELVSPSAVRSAGPNDVPARLYTTKDVFLLTLTKNLLDAGLSLREIRDMHNELRSVPLEELMGLQLVQLPSGTQLVESWSTDNLSSPAIIVPLGEIASRVLSSLNDLVAPTHENPASPLE